MTYHFQPIVDARNGEIFGYEALMRSTLPTNQIPIGNSGACKKPIEALQYRTAHMAQKPGMLQQAYLCRPENLSVYQLDREPDPQRDGYQNGAGQIRADAAACGRGVTEEEKSGEDCTRCKREMARRWYAKIALDDFGTGYNSDVALLSISPGFCKNRYLDRAQH